MPYGPPYRGLALSLTVRDEEKVQAVVDAVKSGTIATASYSQLVTYTGWLALLGSDRLAGSIANHEEVSKVVHLHLLRSVIEAFERRTKVQGWAIIVFAVLAIVATLMPYFIAPNPSGASSQAPTASTSQSNTPQAQSRSQLSAPTPATNPSSVLPTKTP